ncbi:MAG: hypothetical protein PVH04_00205, partial [Gammaproteobacteria bacterium]
IKFPVFSFLRGSTSQCYGVSGPVIPAWQSQPNPVYPHSQRRKSATDFYFDELHKSHKYFWTPDDTVRTSLGWYSQSGLTEAKR